MKKLMLCVLFVVSMLFTCSMVFADAAPPLLSYSATVSNPKGATIYGYDYEYPEKGVYENGTLAYGTTLEVFNYTVLNGQQYIYIYNVQTTDGKEWGYLSIKDVKKKNAWKMSDFHFDEEEVNAVVIGGQELNIYEWPALTENVLGKIPSGTELVLKGIWEDYTWYYTTYNGIKGWVYTRSDILGTRNNPDDQIRTNWAGSFLYNLEGKKIGWIDPNVEFDHYYELMSSWNVVRYYATYKGISGYLLDDDIASTYWEKGQRYTVSYDDAVLIGTDDEIVSIPKETILEYDMGSSYYTNPRFVFTNYMGKEGWIFLTDEWYWGAEEEEEYYQEDVNEIKEAVEKAKDDIRNRSGKLSQIEESGEVNSPVNSGEVVVASASTISSNTIIVTCILCAVMASLITWILIVLINKHISKKALLILIPLIIVCFVVGYLLWNGELIGKSVTREIGKSEEVSELHIPSEENTGATVLKTSYTENFFDVEYGNEDYKNSGKNFGYAKLFQYDADIMGYSSEIESEDIVTASSTLASQGNFSYDVGNILNGNRANTWIEGVSGYGIGEYIEITKKNETSSNKKLSELCIVNGYAENNTKWHDNSRVKTLNLYCDGEKIAVIELMDTIAPQYIDITPLKLEIRGNSEMKLKFEILDVYQGEKYDDTAITGIIIK